MNKNKQVAFDLTTGEEVEFASELPSSFIGRGEVKGFLFEKVESNGYAYIYKVTAVEGARPYYEIFEHRVNTQFGNNMYPKSNSFGKWAWTTYDLDRAYYYYRKATEKVQKSLEKRN